LGLFYGCPSEKFYFLVFRKLRTQQPDNNTIFSFLLLNLQTIIFAE